MKSAAVGIQPGIRSPEPRDLIAERAEAVYGPLRTRGAAIMQRFSDRELEAITAFLGEAADLQLNRANEVRQQLEREGPL